VVSGLAFAALGLPPVVLGVAILVAVYSVAAYGSRWVSLAGLAAAEVGSAAVQLTPGRFQAPTPVSNALVIGAAWLLGYFVGVRRAYTVQLERTAELERTRAELARRAVAGERLRLARELHDVVAHAISVIAVQSGVGAHVADSQPEEAAKALAAIEATSRAALTELRRLLGVLRRDGESQGDLGAGARPGGSGRPAGRGGQGRAGGAAAGGGDAVAAARRGGPVGLPDRPGGADQRGQARWPGTRPGHDRLWRPGGHGGDHRQRAGHGVPDRRRRSRARPRPDRDATVSG